MALLLESRTNGEKKTLYAIAYENWRTGKCGFIYLHATDRADAVNQTLTSKAMGRQTRVVNIAPALGGEFVERGSKCVTVYR